MNEAQPTVAVLSVTDIKGLLNTFLNERLNDLVREAEIKDFHIGQDEAENIMCASKTALQEYVKAGRLDKKKEGNFNLYSFHQVFTVAIKYRGVQSEEARCEALKRHGLNACDIHKMKPIEAFK